MKQNKINNDIKGNSVFLVNDNGVISLDFFSALDRAKLVGLDLVEVGKRDNVPICKIMDYGKYKYEISKKTKKNKKPKTTTKEIKFRPNTGDNDLIYRAKHAEDFLENGNKVKLIVRFRGREYEHMYETGRVLLKKFLAMLNENKFVIDDRAKVEGGAISITLSPPQKAG